MQEEDSNLTVVQGGLLQDSDGNVFCPNCGASIESLQHLSGCVICVNCGWSKCN